MLRLVSGIVALYVLLSKNTSAFNNDATEPGVPQLLPDSPEKVNDRDTNQASNGGRQLTAAVRNGKYRRLPTAIHVNLIIYFF